MDQGIGLLAFYSLVRVERGFLLGIAIATPLGFLLGVSKTLTRMFDPVMQIMRPISPLAWLPLGLILFQKSEPAALFAIAVCSMWPTVINTMAGVRAIPQDYWNVAKVLRLSRFDDVHEDRRAGDAAVHVHRLPAEPRHRLAGDRRQRDADRHARRRRLSLAGIQQPDLRAHPARHPHDRHRRVRAGSADGAGRGAVEDESETVAFIEARQALEVVRRRRGPAATCCTMSRCRSSAASSSRSSARWDAASPRC